MPSNYPGANDTFGVPATPDTTPLSSAGTASRNHSEHHWDLGDAIIAVQQNASTRDHDHSGGGSRPTNKLSQANTHQSPDTDTSPSALHHTLGSGANQAAPGNHNHDTHYPQLDQKNTFILQQTFSGGFAVPNAQWASAQHTHEAANQGGIALPWKHFETRTVNAVLQQSQTGLWDFTIPALPVLCDLEIQVHVNVQAGDNKFQETDFTLSDVTDATEVNIIRGTSNSRRATSTADYSKWSLEIFGVNLNIPANKARTIRVGAVNGTVTSTTKILNLTLIATPFNNF